MKRLLLNCLFGVLDLTVGLKEITSNVGPDRAGFESWLHHLIAVQMHTHTNLRAGSTLTPLTLGFFICKMEPYPPGRVAGQISELSQYL